MQPLYSTIGELTEIVIGLCIKIHSRIGPGCFEKVYEEILCHELSKLGLKFKRQLLLAIDYDELHVKNAYKLDLLIEDQLITELKTRIELLAVDFKQLHTHLSLTNLKHGLLLNFKVAKMKEGIHRMFNNSGREHL